MHLGICWIIHDASRLHHASDKMYFKQHKACKADCLDAFGLMECQASQASPEDSRNPAIDCIMLHTCFGGEHVSQCGQLVRTQ